MPERIVEIPTVWLQDDPGDPLRLTAKLRVTFLDHDPAMVNVTVVCRLRNRPAIPNGMLEFWLLDLLDLCFQKPQQPDEAIVPE